MYHVYITHNEQCDKYYIGQTNNLNRRGIQHNLGLSKYTSKFPGKWIIKYSESFNSRHESIKREKFLKRQKNKEFYRRLINRNI